MVRYYVNDFVRIKEKDNRKFIPLSHEKNLFRVGKVGEVYIMLVNKECTDIDNTESYVSSSWIAKDLIEKVYI